MIPKISFCASSIRPNLWANMYNSLLDNTLDWEIVMVGPNQGVSPGPKFKYIYATVKPAQCYEIAFRNSLGELISWTADDAIYTPRAVDIMYNFYKSMGNDKLVTAFRTIEDGRDITEAHRFIGRNPNAPRMAPFGVINSKLFHNLGGYDKRFLCGQSENDVVMRVLEIGGSVEVCQNAKVLVSHEKAHRSGTKFRTNNFFIDRAALEEEWMDGKDILSKRKSIVQRFDDIDITTKTQGETGGNQW